MSEETQLKQCAFFLVRYVPDIVRDEGLNIGLFLHSPEQEYLDCLITDDFSRIARLHPQADLKLLRDLQTFFEDQIKEHEHDLEGYVREMQDSCSNLIQLTEPRACLTADPSQEIRELFARYVGVRASGPVQNPTRMRVKQALTAALDRAGVLKLKAFERHVPAEQWTEKGDPFTFDFGYKPVAPPGPANGRTRLIHALSLRRDPTLADQLAFKIQRVREEEPAHLTAVVEALPSARDAIARYSHCVLVDHEVVVYPLARLDEYVQSVRQDLAM